MKITNKFNAPTHWSSFIKRGDKPNRTKSAYVCSINPGKSKNTSIPLQYLIQLIEKKFINRTSCKKYLLKNIVLVNKKRQTELKTPIDILDTIEVKSSESDTSRAYTFFYKAANNQKPKPTLIPKELNPKEHYIKSYTLVKKSTIRVHTHKDKLFDLKNTPETLELLKNFKTIISETEKNKLKVIEDLQERYLLTKLTGKDKFQLYQIEEIKRVESINSNYYRFVLKNILKNTQKELIIRLNEMRQRYLLVDKSLLEL